jgi:hypothetical protein
MVKYIIDDTIEKVRSMTPQRAREFRENIFLSPNLLKADRERLLNECETVIKQKPMEDPMVICSEFD